MLGRKKNSTSFFRGDVRFGRWVRRCIPTYLINYPVPFAVVFLTWNIHPVIQKQSLSFSSLHSCRIRLLPSSTLD